MQTHDLALRIYRWLLRLYPRPFVETFSEEMQEVFNHTLTTARQRGPVAVIAICLREIGDLPMNLLSEHWPRLNIRQLVGLTELQNRPQQPLPWKEVALAIVPGLITLGIDSGLLHILLPEPGWLYALLYRLLLPMTCALMVLIGLLSQRTLKAWMYPALGLCMLLLPLEFLNWLYHSVLHLPTPDNKVFYALSHWGVALVLALKYRREISQSRLGWIVLGLAFLASPLFFTLWGQFLIPPLLIGLLFVRRGGPALSLIPVTWIYGMVQATHLASLPDSLASSNHPASFVLLASAPALLFLIALPSVGLRTRSTYAQVLSLSTTAFVGMISLMAIPALWLGEGQDYFVNYGLLTLSIALMTALALSATSIFYATAGSRAHPAPLFK